MYLSSKILRIFSAAVLLLGIFMNMTCAPQKKPAVSTPPAEKEESPMAVWLKDLAFTAREIQQGYVNLAYKEEKFGFRWDDLVADTRRHILRAETEGEFYGLMRELLSHLQDGHTSFQVISRKLQQEMLGGWDHFSLLPDIRWIEERPIIVRAPIKFGCLGWEVISLNGVNFRFLVEKLMPRFSSSNEKTAGNNILERHSYLYYFVFFEKMPESLEMILSDPRTGRYKRIILSPSQDNSPEKESFPEIPFGFPEGKQIIRWDILNDETGYIRIPEFTLPPDTFRKKVKDIIRAFEQKKIKSAVIDLRYNRGGNNSFMYLLRQLAREKILINYYRYRLSGRFLENRRDVLLHQRKVRRSLSEEPESGYSRWFSWTIRPLEENFLSTVPAAVLCNPSCFSSADNFITACLEHDLALVVGNGYGGSGFGFPMKVRLPSQKYAVIYSVWEERDTQKRHKENIVRDMDFFARQSLQDLYDGRDSQLQAALSLLRLKTETAE